jgi:hypothetical protein
MNKKIRKYLGGLKRTFVIAAQFYTVNHKIRFLKFHYFPAHAT